MFVNNKYTKTYFRIIDKYKNIQVDGYVEKHHIIPKSMGGSNDIENIVSLSAKAHFICHHLLIKMTSNREHQIKMIHAFWRMCHSNQHKQKISAMSYENLKKERSRALKEIGNWWWVGRKHTEESKVKMRKSAKGRDPHKNANYNKPAIWNSGLTKENDSRLHKLSVDRKGDKNVMYGRTGKLHPHSKEFTLFDSNGKSIEIFYSLLELKKYCKNNNIPFNGISKTLKTNTPFTDGSKNKRFVRFNGWIAIYN